MSFQALVTILVIGALAGWLTGVITKGRGFGLVGNMIVGVLGAFLGRFVFGVVGIQATSTLGQFLFAVAGALLFVWLLRFIKR